MIEPARVGLRGFGLAGSVFHASLIPAEPRLQLVSIASSRASEVLKRFPAVAVRKEPAEVIADPALDLVVIATPDTTHALLARSALEAGKHVVIDKPMAMSAAEGASLVALAGG